MGKKEACMEQPQSQLGKWSSQIDELRSGRAKGDLQLKYEGKTTELRAKQETVRNTLPELQVRARGKGLKGRSEKGRDELKGSLLGSLDGLQ